jgi:hypothetical protein
MLLLKSMQEHPYVNKVILHDEKNRWFDNESDINWTDTTYIYVSEIEEYYSIYRDHEEIKRSASRGYIIPCGLWNDTPSTREIHSAVNMCYSFHQSL